MLAKGKLSFSCGVLFVFALLVLHDAGAAIDIGYSESFETATIPPQYSFPDATKAWTIDSTYAADGSNSLRSATILDNESSSIVLNDTFSDGVLKILTRVDAEYSDVLKVVLDNDEANAVIVHMNYRWKLVSVPINAGAHKIEIRYQKDISSSQNADAAWIDYIRFDPVKAMGATSGNILISSNAKIYEYDVNGWEQAEFDTNAVYYSHYGDLVLNTHGDIVALAINLNLSTKFLEANVFNPITQSWAATPISLEPAQTYVRDQADGRLTAYDNTFILTSTTVSTAGSGGLFQYNVDSGVLSQYFPTLEFDSVNIGLDGKLYAIEGSGSTRSVHVIDPSTFTEINSYIIPQASTYSYTSATANASGVIYVTVYYATPSILKFDPNDAANYVLFTAPDPNHDFIDIDIRPDGLIVASGTKGEILVTDENFSFARQFFASDNLSPGNSYVSFARNPMVDNDGDGMSDGWEAKYSSNGNLNPNDDLDNDGLSNLEEYTHHTDPTVADTDNDGLNDGAEINTHHTDPLNSDSDGDGLLDGEEITAGTLPLDSDSDKDGLSDGDEVHTYGSNPLDTDSDKDGISDGDEVNVYHSDPTKTDTDADGLPDNYEILYPLIMAPNDAADAALDPDLDGLNNLREYQNSTLPNDADTDKDGLGDGRELDLDGTDPTNPDTDGDTLTDGYEVLTSHTDPTKADTDGDGLNDNVDPFPLDPNNGNSNGDSDGDGMPDAWENQYNNTDANTADADADLDNDGLSNLAEYQNNTNPDLADSDSDGLNDGSEVNTYLTDPTKADSDGDSLSDGDEVNTYHSDPTKIDSDGDTLNDGDEVNTYHTDPTKADSDGDTLSDADEVNTYLTDPTKADTDGDGMNDNVDPYPLDPNNNAGNSDSDGDGMPDAWENQYNNTDATSADASADLDNDGMSNLEEYQKGTNPDLTDSDGDGINDGDEVFVYLTNPNKSDSDDDGLPDAWEIQYNNSEESIADANADLDLDGLDNLAEYNAGTNPDLADTDGDGVNDGDEIAAGTNPLVADNIGGGNNSGGTQKANEDDNSGLGAADPIISGLLILLLLINARKHLARIATRRSSASI